MNDSMMRRVGALMLLLAASACRGQPQTWPADEADLTGQIIEVRTARGLEGFSIVPAGGSATGTGDIQRMRVRVLGARTTTPGSEAIVGVDGVTSVVRAAVAGRGTADWDELEGAFVRIWFRGVPRRITPTTLSAMVRVMAIDSVVAR
jgi:hypothetical protein